MEEYENLLVIGRDSSLYDLLKKSSLSQEFNINFCNVEEDILSFIKTHNIRIVLLDSEEASSRELNFLKKMKKFDSLLNIIVAGNPIPPEEVLEWIHQGAFDYLTQPLEIETIQAAIRKVMEKRELRRTTHVLEQKLEKKYIFQDVISKNPAMFEVFSLIEKIARHFTSVLILGETGTGKEMVARAIHNLSPAKNKNLVICDCASIPENLFESELFGYVRGAFTGADRNKRGLFEEAHEGTIFLDEIAEIPLPVQAKLLRVLENRQFRPLGSNETRHVNVKIIAATNQNLSETVKKNEFREDLYHRLNRIEIHLPPLRERPEDILLLARHFLQQYNPIYSKNIRGVSRDVQKLLLKYDWPGNIRELENVLQSAVLQTKREFIDVGDLPKNLRDFIPPRHRIPFLQKEGLASLEDLEKEYISYLLKMTNSNLSKTAKILNISRTTLYNKLTKYNLPH
ncbi:MAG: sigma-54 dependent transcriptional regulator [Candidatus Aminicenantales bacterium]